MAKKREKKNVKRKAKQSKEEVCEIFEIEKDGKEKVVKSCGVEKEKPATEGQLKKEKKIFAGILIVMGACVLFFLAFWAITYFSNHFEIEGVKFEVDKTSVRGRTLYKTSLPGIINKSGSFVIGNYKTGQKADYNIYFRKDPRQLQEMSFYGGIKQIKWENVINMTDSFNCNGDGVIAIANLLKLHEVMGANIIQDANASCDYQGKYGWIGIQEGNETLVDRFGPACYTLYVNDCEILKVTEKFMLEVLIKANKKLEE